MPRKVTEKSYTKEQIAEAIVNTASYLNDMSLLLAGTMLLTALEHPEQMDKIFNK